MTFKEFLEKKDEFLTSLEVEKNVTHHTLRAYNCDLNQFIQFWQTIQNDSKEEIALLRTIERFFVHLYHKKISKSSIARKISCFRSLENYLQAQSIELNLNIQRPKIDKKLPVFLTIDEMLHLLDNVGQEELPSKFPHRDKAILELLYATGIRCSELVSIKIKNINTKEKTIRILGKGRQERLALFGSKAYEKIMNYLIYERTKAETTDEYLFLNHRYQKLTTRSVQRIIQMFRQFLKIDKPISPHKIRHSFATHLIHQGVDVRVVQELLGHKDIGSTERYTHISTERLTEIFDTIHPIHNIIKRKNETE